MRVLFVASLNRGSFAPFIVEQALALESAGCEVGFFGVEGRGVGGYLSNLSRLKSKIDRFEPDVVHAHYGLCGLLSGLQRKAPVVTTYHGSDINDKSVLGFSRIAMRLSAYNIFVSERTRQIASPSGRWSIVPCGINLEDYPEVPKDEARRLLGLDMDARYVLFSSGFDNEVKNYPLAAAAAACLPGMTLLELKGYCRSQVNLIMRASDAMLMTSHTEGSPQVVKEALACGLPVVSVDVGDVAATIGGLEGCRIVGREPALIAEALKAVCEDGRRIDGRGRLVEYGLSNDMVASKLMDIYGKVKDAWIH